MHLGSALLHTLIKFIVNIVKKKLETALLVMLESVYQGDWCWVLLAQELE